MKKIDLIQQVHQSQLLPESVKRDTLQAIDAGEIICGLEAVQTNQVPRVVAAGSFDPATYGHMRVINTAQQLDPNAGVVIIGSTTKSADYQLFSMVERAAIIRSYGHSPKTIIGAHSDPDAHKALLSQLHQQPEIIVKGVRRAEDSEHTASLVEKYQVEPEKFHEMRASPSIENISSGDVKGMTWQQLQQGGHSESMLAKIKACVPDYVHTWILNALHQRPPEQNEIFLRRLEAGCSEALFG